MIERFTCRNYRNITISDLEMKRINLLVGPNNSGKTNFIRAISFLPDMLLKKNVGGLKSAFLNAVKRNGWDHLRNNQAEPSDAVEFAWNLLVEGEALEYKFSFLTGKKIEDCHITLEEMNHRIQNSDRYEKPFNYYRCHDPKIGEGKVSTAVNVGRKNKRLSFQLNSQETIMSQYHNILLQKEAIYTSDTARVEIAGLLSKIQEYFEGNQTYATSKFALDKIRNMVEDRSVDLILNENADNFINVYSNRVANNMNYASVFFEKMRELIPDLESIDLPVLYDKLLFRMRISNKVYDLTDVSDGTLKTLILNLLINAPVEEKHSLLSIDEPETNLHPAWQKVVGQWILNSASFDQCIISTHSPDFLDCFTDSFRNGDVQILVFDSDEKYCVRVLNYEHVINELGDWELGDLYRTNDPALGGWPW